MSLEVFDDVGVQSVRGDRIASQTKSGLVKNPISDRAVDLWKTFSNWLSAVETGVLDPEHTLFELYVGRKHRGRIAETFHAARSDADARIALKAARVAIWGAAPQYRRRRYIAERVFPYLDHVLDPGSEKLVASIIARFQLNMAHRDPLTDLRQRIATEWIRPESIDEILRYAQGWVKERTDALILRRHPAIISVDDFKAAIVSFLPRCDFRTIVGTYAGPPAAEQVHAERVRTYVRQLDLIELDDEDLIEAINDCLRASVVRAKLAEQGIINEESFSEFADGLVGYWRNKSRYVRAAFSAADPIRRGQILLSECCTHTQKLQGLEVPPFFTPGSYHSLANEATVGWHPDYKSMLGLDTA